MITFNILVGFCAYLYILGILIILVVGEIQFGDSGFERIFDLTVLITYPISIPILIFFDKFGSIIKSISDSFKYLNGKINRFSDVDFK